MCWIENSGDAVCLEESPNGFDGNGIAFKAKLIGKKREFLEIDWRVIPFRNGRSNSSR